MSLYLYGAMVCNVWIQWVEDPVTFSYTEKPMGMEIIPFPTVTICPATKAQSTDIFNLTDALLSLSDLSDVQ